MNECIDHFGEAAVSSTRVADPGYGQMGTVECNQDKLLRLKYTSATFHGAIDVFLNFVRWQIFIAYFRDIFVFSESPVNHNQQVRHLSRLLYKARITLKPKKGRCLTETIDYLHHAIRLGGDKLSERTPGAMAKLENLTKQTEQRSFQGLCNAFTLTLPNIACLITPSTKCWDKTDVKLSSPLTVRKVPRLGQKSSAARSWNEELIRPLVQSHHK